MKYFAFLFLAVAATSVNANTDKLQCQIPPNPFSKTWITMVPPCTKKLRDQVQTELTAAMTYLAMGAHFSQDTVNRPGFAKFFLDSASEERQHAIKIIDYLLMRGELVNEISELIQNPKPIKTSWTSGVEALNDALELEASVTAKIRAIIAECESPSVMAYQKFNDYHLVDYLSGDFLTEQYQGQRDLAGKISTLGKMMNNHGALGEFLFDKKMLSNDV